MNTYDLILAGGGLANGLIALKLRQTRPELRILLIEQGDRLGGNHTWSFHEPDLTTEQHAWIEPLVAHRWARYQVFFPGLERTLSSGYASISAERFHDVLMERLSDSVRLNATVSALGPTEVRFANGEAFQAAAVLDGRGHRPSPHMGLGFQKFLGQELQLAQPHGLSGPIIMDATVPQTEGYRFIYVLPLTQDRVLIEDTYYADGQNLDPDRLRDHIARYAADHGWTIQSLIREEHGVLPITLSGDIEAFWAEAGDIPPTGLAAGLFHATTGYSLPEAVRLAELIAGCPRLDTSTLVDTVRRHALQRWRTYGFFRLLNRMLFLAGKPEHRYRVMRRFYGLPEPLIQRFYAGQLKPSDKLRILTGKPPVPLREALTAALASRTGQTGGPIKDIS
ncbi:MULTISPECIES: lycopene beta-cyclase CrtY [Pseudomonas]|uniref:Lycopene beta-cyclase CrtY n=1 Tax=Pseudomonas luteola TaxID=47886 RepID=A0A2X2D864_PSELU|nr:MULTISPECIES: lycopene beta-cyclase CrtY [Pseudomonas]ENA36625.1 lycopene cyclase [Pseudomonas sp. HPB0071]MBF8639969.1 lycopene beta-cyclase CrtY [Pseudomonas zeshuii]RRW44233.1 lycopene cyclase [Pseudomonas luteola]SHI32292.1 lycopene beta-cyclase [Pseudomonas zeshuii]SPZ08515.1 lycopene cyclase [Pseudomonas luteola]